jgi:hypothetical protein
VVGSLELWSSDDVLCSLMMIQFSDRRLVVRRKALAATTRYHYPLDSIVIDRMQLDSGYHSQVHEP